MNNNYLNRFKLGLKSLVLVMVTGILAFNANAQTIEFDSIPPAGGYFLNAPALLEFDSAMGGGQFPSEATFYLHTGTLEDNPENIFGQANSVGTLNFTWRDLGFFNDLRLTAATGDVERTFNDLGEDDATFLGGFFNGANYVMSDLGRRRIETPSIDLSGTATTVLEVTVDRSDIDLDRPLRVFISVDQATFVVLTDTSGTQAFHANAPDNLLGNIVSLQFELQNSQKTSDVRFRIDQGDDTDNSFGAGEEDWTVFGSSSMTIQGEELDIINAQFLGNNYTISEPSTTAPVVNITSAVTDQPGSALVTDFNVGTIRPGDTVQVISFFDGDATQLSNYDYSAVFERNNVEFLLDDVESRTVSIDGGADSIVINGIVPFGIDEINETWTLEVRALADGDTPIAGRVVNLDLDEDEEEVFGVGGTETGSTWTFDQDSDRSLTTIGLTVSSADSTTITFDLAKETTSFVPSGSEIEISFREAGATMFTPLDTIDLNSDLSDAVMIEGLPTDAVSSSTEFRIKQLGDNGAGLSPWSISSFRLETGSTFINEGSDEIEYTAVGIDINAPFINLDPAGIPDAGVFPGSTVDFTYDVLAGVIEAGTEYELVTLIGAEDFILTTFTPGVNENGMDFSFSAAMPAFEGGDFNVFLRAGDSQSGTVTIPFEELTIVIDTVTVATMREDVLEAGTEIIFPGDDIEVQFTIDGTIESMAELFLEVRDYDRDDTDNDGYMTLTSMAGPISNSGSITGTLPTNIDYNDGGTETPSIRLRVGSGLLVENDFVTGLRSATGSTNGNLNLFNEDYFPNDLKVGITSSDDFSGPGERSVTSFPIAMPFGGEITITLDEANFGNLDYY